MLSLLGSIFAPIGRIIEKAVPDADLRRQIEAEIVKELMNKDSELAKAQAQIITAEAKGESWLQRSWRPITMLTFLALICSYFLGLAPVYIQDNPDVADKLFSLVQVGLGGYVVGRSGEKIVKTLADNGGAKALMQGRAG